MSAICNVDHDALVNQINRLEQAIERLTSELDNQRSRNDRLEATVTQLALSRLQDQQIIRELTEQNEYLKLRNQELQNGYDSIVESLADSNKKIAKNQNASFGCGGVLGLGIAAVFYFFWGK